MKTEQDAYLTLAALCAQAEHCQYEMLEKMRRWELSEEAQARVMAKLIKERYVDDERYAHAFVKDVMQTNHAQEVALIFMLAAMPKLVVPMQK